MGNMFSHRRDEDVFYLSSVLHDDKLLYTCETAFQNDAAVRSFDNAMKDGASRVLRSFKVTPDVQSERFSLESTSESTSLENQGLSFESLKESTSFLLKVDHEVMEVILSYRHDTWNNDELFVLVDEYLDISYSQVDFCMEAENSIKRAKDAQSILETALKSVPFDRDPNANDIERASVYLKMFLEAREPFGKEFWDKLDAVQKRHIVMLKKLKEQKRKLDKKLHNNHVWANVSSILFIASIATVLICSVIAAAIAAPPVAAALAAAATVPFGSMGAWVKSFWNKHEQEIKAQLDLLRTMETHTVVSVHELESIKRLVDKFQIQLASTIRVISFGGSGSDTIAVRLALDDIKRQKEGFVSALDDLHEHICRIKNESKVARERVVDMLAKREHS